MAMGERTPLAAIDAPASGRMAVAEAITNLLAAPIELPRVKLSANWMAACGEPAKTPRCTPPSRPWAWSCARRWASPFPWARTACPCARSGARTATKKVTSPVSLIVTGFAAIDDVRGTLTPQLDATEDDSTLVLIDLGRGKNRMGGSILGQVLDQSGDEVPDLDDAKDLIALVDAVNALRAKGQILAYHDRATAACWPRWPKWPLPAMWAWR
jgi:phosphoribosylformylglycinamidine synthase